MAGRVGKGTGGDRSSNRQLGLFEPAAGKQLPGETEQSAAPDIVTRSAYPASKGPRPPVTADRSPRFEPRRIAAPKVQERLILLLDMDAFFASAEQVARPELKGKPVIVGGLATDRSVVASASYEARAMGVKTAMPIAQARRICPQGVFLRGNYALYASLSKKVMEICNTFTPLVQQASIDEAYMDLAGTQRLYSRNGRGQDSGFRVQGSGVEGQDSGFRVQGSGVEGQDSGFRVQGSGAGGQDSGFRVQGSGGRIRISSRKDEEPAEASTDGNRQLRQDARPGTGADNATLAHSVQQASAGLQLLPTEPRTLPTEPRPLNPEPSMPWNWPVALAERLLRRIREQTGLGATIGIGSNKLVARMAMQWAKPGGICHIWPGQEAAFLAACPLADVPGIGPRTAAMLADYNLRTAADVQKTSRELLVATFGERFGGMLHDCAFGRGSERLRMGHEQKSVGRDTSFEQDTTDMEYIRSMLYYLTERACRALRRMEQAAWTVSVKLRYSDFVTVSKARTLCEPTNHDDTVYQAARDLLEKLYTRPIAVRLVGVHLSGLAYGRQVQLRIWESRETRRSQLCQVSDRIRDRYGFCALMKGPAIALMDKMEHDAAGLKLRTSCLTK